MRVVMVMFDTLCRRFLPSYGCDWIQAPNFRRLAERTVQFDNAYVGSMPCMPARREIHTGRHNFLHRSWGPLEPFDESMPEALARSGCHSHKVTDHYHYWEDGGATYHGRYSTFSFVRGQEGDPCHGFAGSVVPPPKQMQGIKPGRVAYGDHRSQDWVNRSQFRCDADMPQHKTFSEGIAFLERNAAFDDWFCQIETFDPHEPFFVQEEWKKLYPHGWDPELVHDWPRYERISGDSAEVEHMVKTYAALVSFCDRNLGRVLDTFDRLDLWKDTMLIVNTDHGFLLGEHDWWAKCRMPFWQEVAHIPLWIWDPRCGIAGERRQSLVQTIDLAPTILDVLGRPLLPHMQGRPLAPVIARDEQIRAFGIYGIHGGHVNITDGRWVYMRGPDPARGNQPLWNYTVMPTHMRSRFSLAEMRTWERHPGFAFTQGSPVMAFPSGPSKFIDADLLGTKLYDLQTDYEQQHVLHDAAQETRLITALVGALEAGEAPPEQYQRLGLPDPAALRRDPALAGAARHL